MYIKGLEDLAVLLILKKSDLTDIVSPSGYVNFPSNGIYFPLECTYIVSSLYGDSDRLPSGSTVIDSSPSADEALLKAEYHFPLIL